LGNIAAIADYLAGQALGQLGYGLAVIDIARSDAKGEQFALVIDHEMELEPVEPAHGGFAPAGDFFEDLTQPMGKLASTMLAQMQQVKSLEIAVLRLMEIDQYRHDLAEGQPAGSPPFPFAAA